MKYLAAILVLATVGIAHAEDTLFEVSKVGETKNKDLLYKLYDEVWVQSTRGEAGVPLMWTVTQRIKRGEYLGVAEKGDERETVHVEILEDTEAGLPDGTEFGVWERYLEGETYRYTTVLGAERGVRSYKQLPDKEEMTKEKFLKRLKAGEEFRVTIKLHKQCPTCDGSGRVTQANVFLREKDGKSSCEQCEGQGKVDQIFRIVWEEKPTDEKAGEDK